MMGKFSSAPAVFVLEGSTPSDFRLPALKAYFPPTKEKQDISLFKHRVFCVDI
jgi:hypothetical protein